MAELLILCAVLGALCIAHPIGVIVYKFVSGTDESLRDLFREL